VRRIFALATEGGKVDKPLLKVRMLPGERHPERVLAPEEERVYFENAQSSLMDGHADPRLVYDVATLLLDCALRPEECFRLTWGQVRDGGLEILDGKTANARRRIPLSARAAAVLEMRCGRSESE
jgi:integrase